MKKTDTLEKSDSFFDKLAELPLAHRIIICVVTFASVIGAFIFLSYMPNKEEISKLSDKLSSLETKLADAKKQAQKLDRLKREKKEAENQFRIVLRALPDKKEIPKLLTSISQSGRNSGLEFIKFQPQKEQKKDFYAEIPVKIQVVGSYHNLASFFGRLAQLHRIVNVQNIKIETDRQNTKKILSECSAVTYKFIEPDKIPKKDKKGKSKKKK